MQGEKNQNFDEATSFLGDYGRFQVTMIVLLSLSTAPCGYMGMIAVFVSDTPEHFCKMRTNSTRYGADVRGRSSWIGPDSCSRSKLDRNWTGEVAAALTNDTEPCLDGWVYSTERHTIVSEWDLVCDNAWKVPFSTSLFFVGALFGSLISGQLSDRFGRKPVFFATIALQTVTALIQATSINWVMFSVLNCLRGVGQIANFVTSLVLGSEILGQSVRVCFTLLFHNLGFAIGFAVLPIFAYFIRGWRMLLVASAIPGFLFIPTWWVIPESPRWLLETGRVKKAELVIRRAAKMNEVPAPEVIFRSDECFEIMQNKAKDERMYTYMDLIRIPNIRNTVAIGIFVWMSISMVFYGLSLNTSNLSGNVYLNSFFSAVSDIVVCIAIWLLVKKVPRPTFLFSALMICGIMLLIIKLVPEDIHVAVQMLAIVARMGVSVANCFAFVFFAELIPTVVRSMGLGVCSTATGVGTISCAYVIYTGIYSKILPYIIFGTISIMAAVVSMLLPDTRNSRLPDLTSEARPIRGFCSLKETPAALTETVCVSLEARASPAAKETEGALTSNRQK